MRVQTLGTEVASTFLGGEACDQCNGIVDGRCGFVCDMDVQIRRCIERQFKKTEVPSSRFVETFIWQIRFGPGRLPTHRAQELMEPTVVTHV